jgi:hypothetical protein
MASGPTYEPIATYTATGTIASYTFSSISQSYSDLVLVCVFAFNISNNSLQLQFNGDTATNYSQTSFEGYNSTYDSYKTSNQTKIAFAGVNIGAGTSITTPSSCTAHINNYSGTVGFKNVISRWSTENDAGSREVGTLIGSWRSTSAISSITILSQNSIISGSTFTLYGIAKA